MNVLLVNPASHYLLKMFQDISQLEIPLSLAYLASTLEREGHIVKIIDLNVVSTKKELKFLLGTGGFDIIGVTSTTPVISSCFKTIKVLKRLYPDAKIIVGGWHASTMPIQTLDECKEVDFVVKGEGEETIVELVQNILNGKKLEHIRGIAYRDKSGISHETEDRPLIKDLDTLPFPARQLLPLEAYKKIGFYTLGGYFKKDLYVCSIITSRGCANRCAFCADHVIYKETCRFRSPENVVAEIEEMIRKDNIRIVFFFDTDFFLSPIHVKRICELIIEKKMKFIWGCSGRVNHISKDLLQLMKRAGCIRISFGVESGSPRILRSMHKNILISQVKKVMAMAKDVGMPVYISFLYGMPGETIKDAKMTRQLLWELKPDFMAQSAIVPYPGTDLYDYAFQRNLIKEASWESYSYLFNSLMDQPDAKKVINYQKKTQRNFYTSPFFFMKSLKNLKSIYHLGFYLRAIYSFIRFNVI